MWSAFVGVALGALVTLAPAGADWLLRRPFPVPPHGSLMLVTGARSGVGRAVAARLAARGFSVLAGVRRPSDVADVRGALPRGARVVVVDVSRADHIEKLLDEMDVLGAPLAGVAACAGVALPGSAEAAPWEAVEHVFAVNTLGPLRVVRALLPRLREAGGGRVVGVTAGAAASGPFDGLFGASKRALEAALDTMRQEFELAGFNTSVSAVAPGRMATPHVLKALGLAKNHGPHGLTDRDRRLGYEPAWDVFRREHERCFVAGSRRPSGACATVDAAADAVVHALTSQFPHTHYAVDTWNPLAHLFPKLAL